MSSYGEKPSLSYNKYLKVRELVELQSRLALPEKHDELLFIIIHQTFELWFKQILHELDATIVYIKETRIMRAVRNLRRVCEIEKILVDQFKILETMTPHDFLLFRDELKPASGFQSTQFREIEFLSGLKDEKLMRFFDEEFAVERLSKRFGAETLHDAYFDFLQTRDFAVDTFENRVESVVKIIKDIEQFPEEFELQEVLIEHDELVAHWRFHHIKMVERTVGGKQGTGGSEGVGYLATTLAKRFYPEFWEARTRLEIE
ncbi:MAG TPA: tryptophan 2,3-dioxygenase family protein [Pyrinomonadaceae bacterium]|nr:tryptophan 2,3-dioxygenase family protein [Pyrinomonadaceae bacterium]